MISKLLSLAQETRVAFRTLALLVDNPLSDSRGTHIVVGNNHVHMLTPAEVEDALRCWIKAKYIPAVNAKFIFQTQSGEQHELTKLQGVDIVWPTS